MKKVLIVAYHFPPSNAVGALRPAKFAEYLPEFGWEPIVLAGDEEVGEDEQIRFSRTSAASDTCTTHVRAWPGLRDIWRKLKQGLTAAGRSKDPGEEAQWRQDFEQTRERRGPVVRLRELVYGLMSLPDEYHGWILPAVYHGLRLVDREQADVILATSPPHSAQLAGLLIARLAGLPLVADFRDPWIGNPATPDYVRGGPTYAAEHWLETRVLDTAARVVAATPEHAAKLADRGEALRTKIRVIPNGFDASSFQGLQCGGAEKFTITYVGNFYHSRSPKSLFDGLSRLMADHHVDPRALEIRFVGDCDYAEGRSVRQMAVEAGLNGCLTLVGQLPHERALAEVTRSDLLLLLATEQPHQVPTKAYEYLAAGRPVLALVDEGATARLMAEAGAGVITGPDPEAIAAALERRLEAWRQEEATPWSCPSTAIPFERRETTRVLAAMLHDLSGP